jgi:hypothetical protein
MGKKLRLTPSPTEVNVRMRDASDGPLISNDDSSALCATSDNAHVTH